MGRSAKFHKRQNKKTTSSAGTGSSASLTISQASVKLKPAAAVAAAKEQSLKKRAGLKAKAKIAHKPREGEGPVLGGADYVELMFGGRRKAAAEAAKLPKDDEMDS